MANVKRKPINPYITPDKPTTTPAVDVNQVPIPDKIKTEKNTKFKSRLPALTITKMLEPINAVVLLIMCSKFACKNGDSKTPLSPLSSLGRIPWLLKFENGVTRSRMKTPHIVAITNMVSVGIYFCIGYVRINCC